MDPARWQTVKDVFSSALEHGPEARAAFIDGACGADAELRAEVDSLLQAHAGAADFIEAPAAQRVTGLSDSTQGHAWIGRRVGVYRIVEEVGRGGMSEVYKAIRDDDEFHKEVAVKVLRHGYDTDSLLKRFRVEMQILASLDHPHIARLLDGGSTPEGLPYLVMDYIKGVPIDDYCRQHQLGIAQRLELFRTLCAAVQYVHQNLMVHGDLKCGNVLVTETGSVRLLDFGIARLLGPVAGMRIPERGLAGLVALTPEYASPEQFQGAAISTASDVYSLGVVFYRILTGGLPYTDSGASDSPWRLRGDLDCIARMALQKAPSDRYSSVEQLSEDIRRHLQSFPVVARPATLPYTFGKFASRHTAVLSAATLFVLTLITGIVATAWEAHVAGVQRARAERHFDDVRRLANSFMLDVNTAIENLPGSTPARQMLVTNSLEYLDALSAEAADNPSLKRELATAYEKVADVQGGFRAANLGDTAGALASYRKALAIRTALAAVSPSDRSLRRELLRNYGKLSDVLMSSGDTAGAIDSSRRTVALAEALVAATDQGPADRIANRRNLGNAYLGLGLQMAKSGDVPHGLEYMNRGTAIYEGLVAADPGDVTSRRNLALAYGRAGETLLDSTDRYEDARLMHGKTLAIVRGLADADPHNGNLTKIEGYALLGIGGALVKEGKTQEALGRQSQAVSLFRALADADPKNEEAQRDLADALKDESLTRQLTH